MSDYLSPQTLANHWDLGKTQIYLLLKEFERTGGEIIKIGKATRVSQTEFDQYMREKYAKHSEST
jgi:hypothetical protein